MSWYKIEKYHELYDREKAPTHRDEKKFILYWHPDYSELLLVYPEDTARLKAYLRSSENFLEVINRAAKRGFPVYFQPLKSPFTSMDLYRIMEQKELKGMVTFQCRHYSRRVVPAICIANSIKWPIKHSKAVLEEIKQLQQQLRLEDNPDDKKRIRRKLNKVKKLHDPYPKCRRCFMATELNKRSCLGVFYDPKDEDCKECDELIECIHLMRLRIQKIMEGGEKEVLEEVTKQVDKSAIKIKTQEME